MTAYLITTLSIAIGLLVLFLILKTVMKAVGDSMGSMIAVEFPEGEVLMQEPKSTFMGQKSKELAQASEDGGLVLTRDGLHFVPSSSGMSLTIPVDRILNLSTPRRFLGKSKTFELLQVDFKSEDGVDDSAAFTVSNPKSWLQAIQSVMG